MRQTNGKSFLKAIYEYGLNQLTGITLISMKQNSVAQLYILDFGLFQVHSNGRVIGIQGYLIKTHAGENILVDTGFPAKYAEDVQSASEEDQLGDFGQVLSLTPENLLVAQLAHCGLQTSDVDTLILTHTHIDHVGGIGDFPGVHLVISQLERKLPKPLYWNGNSPLEWPVNVQYHLIDGETTLRPGLVLLPTPGHSPGHLSLLVTLRQTGPVLLTADAISRPSEPEEGFEGSWDPIQAQASADMLLARAKRVNAMIIYGHDPMQWPMLPKAPKFFD